MLNYVHHTFFALLRREVYPNTWTCSDIQFLPSQFAVSAPVEVPRWCKYSATFNLCTLVGVSATAIVGVGSLLSVPGIEPLHRRRSARSLYCTELFRPPLLQTASSVCGSYGRQNRCHCALCCSCSESIRAAGVVVIGSSDFYLEVRASRLGRGWFWRGVPQCLQADGLATRALSAKQWLVGNPYAMKGRVAMFVC